MKIYPSDHKIMLTDKVNDVDIPLAYINSKEDYDIDISCEYNYEEKRIVMPYEYFNNYDTIFINNYNKEIMSNLSLLKRDDKKNKYYFLPNDCLISEPRRFNYSILCKKNITYNSRDIYNININCDNEKFSKNLIQILSDAPDRNICPNNIFVNHKETNPLEFLNLYENTDFIFVNSEDGQKYSKSNVDINYKQYLSEHKNIWINLNNDDIKKDFVEKKIEIEKPVLYNNSFYTMDYCIEKSYIDTIINNISESYIYHTFFKDYDDYPIYIIEVSNNGFIIVSNDIFFQNIDKNKELFYEILMYVYSNAYLESKKYNTWITPYVPDYIVKNNNITRSEKIKHEIDISKIFSIKKEDISIIDIKIDTNNVIIEDISDDYIVFKQIGYSDEEQSEYKTIFTNRQNIIHYKNEYYIQNDNIKNKLQVINKNNEISLIVSPFIYSQYGINIKTEYYFKLKMERIVNSKIVKVNNICYILYYNNGILNITTEDNIDKNALILAKININKNINGIDIYDMRKRGGGSTSNNNDLFDVGHVYGRPYRKGGSLIITMEKKYELYKDIIYDAVTSHMVSEDYLILLFED